MVVSGMGIAKPLNAINGPPRLTLIAFSPFDNGFTNLLGAQALNSSNIKIAQQYFFITKMILRNNT